MGATRLFTGAWRSPRLELQLPTDLSSAPGVSLPETSQHLGNNRLGASLWPTAHLRKVTFRVTFFNNGRHQAAEFSKRSAGLSAPEWLRCCGDLRRAALRTHTGRVVNNVDVRGHPRLKIAGNDLNGRAPKLVTPPRRLPVPYPWNEIL